MLYVMTIVPHSSYPGSESYSVLQVMYPNGWFPVNGQQVLFFEYIEGTGADPGFMLGGGAPLRNDVTIQDFSQEGVHL